MKIKFKGKEEKELKEIETEARNIKELLERKDINPVTHVVSLNGEIVTEDEELSEGDEVKIQKVVSGG